MPDPRPTTFDFPFDEKFFDAVVARAGGIRLRSKHSPRSTVLRVNPAGVRTSVFFIVKFTEAHLHFLAQESRPAAS
jgi:hypothetical protein